MNSRLDKPEFLGVKRCQEECKAVAFHAFVPEYGIHIGTRSNDENPDLPKFAEWFFRDVWNFSTLQQSWRAAQQ